MQRWSMPMRQASWNACAERAREERRTEMKESVLRTSFVALIAFLGLAACETVEGFGQDVEAGGEAIQDASNEVQEDL